MEVRGLVARRLHLVPHPALALKRSLRLRLETSCIFKKDASFKEQVALIRNVHGVHANVPLRLGKSSEWETQKIEESEVRDMSGTLVAPECCVAAVSDVNGTLVAVEDTNDMLATPESHVATARIDWIGMSNEDYKKRIKEMAQSPLPRSHLMSEEEFVDFCIRREEMLFQAGKRVSKFYQDVDLPAQLHRLRGEQLSKSDTGSWEHGTVARKKRAKKRSLDNFHVSNIYPSTLHTLFQNEELVRLKPNKDEQRGIQKENEGNGTKSSSKKSPDVRGGVRRFLHQEGGDALSRRKEGLKVLRGCRSTSTIASASWRTIEQIRYRILGAWDSCSQEKSQEEEPRQLPYVVSHVFQ